MMLRWQHGSVRHCLAEGKHQQKAKSPISAFILTLEKQYLVYYAQHFSMRGYKYIETRRGAQKCKQLRKCDTHSLGARSWLTENSNRSEEKVETKRSSYE
jgi:hypothetical protein